MENVFHRTLYDTWNKLSTLWLKLNHVGKRGPGRNQCIQLQRNWRPIHMEFFTIISYEISRLAHSSYYHFTWNFIWSESENFHLNDPTAVSCKAGCLVAIKWPISPAYWIHGGDFTRRYRAPIAPTIILHEISYEVRVKIFIWMTPQLCRAKLAA